MIHTRGLDRNRLAWLPRCAIVTLLFLGSGSTPADEDSRGPAVAVLARYPGMPVELMERDIMSRLERWTGQAAGVERQEAVAMPGLCVVKCFFRPSVSQTDAVRFVTTLTLSDLFYLPPGTIPPVVVPFDPSFLSPAGLVCISTPANAADGGRDRNLLSVAEAQIRNRLSAIRGVFAPTVYGGQLRHVAVSFDPDKLAAFKLSPNDVRKVLLEAAPKRGNGPNAQAGFMERLENIVVRKTGEAPVLLRDLAFVRVSQRPASTLARLNGRPVVCVPVWAQPGAVGKQVRKSVESALAPLKSKLPHGCRLEWLAIDADGKPGTAGLLTMFVRAPSGVKLADVGKEIVQVERLIEKQIPRADRRWMFSQVGLNPDSSAIYSRHSGPEDATIRVQLAGKAQQRAGEHARRLRGVLKRAFPKLEFGFHAGASLEPPLIVRITGPSLEHGHALAEQVRARLSRVAGAVDVHVAERMVPAAQPKGRGAKKAADDPVPRFWIDPATGGHYFVGAPLAAPGANDEARRPRPAQISHVNITRAIHVRVNVEGRQIPEVAGEISKILSQLKTPKGIRAELIKSVPRT